ncbi:conserved hypothetical protein [Lysobacter enzymogenes]|uniref:ATPase AAA-type core domain-containing protein n=1 Tax=Lysobacter enzymogenes TaxID=69 RepID=A0AAU9AWZ6_LYSEN|nr:conserved hypothetical protein [Lysobacter enzymogenes]
MLRLSSVYYDGAEVPLVGGDAFRSASNTFTVLVGKNGLGKSRLLSRIAKECITAVDDPDAYNWPRSKMLRAGPLVIAISTSPFDKFPAPPRKKDRYTKNYRYVGMRGESMFITSSSISLLSSVTRGLLSKLVLDSNASNLMGVFSALSFFPEFEFIFKPSFSQPYNQNKYDDGIIMRVGGHSFQIDKRFSPAFETMSREDRSYIEYALENVSELFNERKTFSLNVDFLSGGAAINGRRIDLHEVNSISILMDIGLVRLMDIRAIKDNYGPISLRSASSGEQCMLVLMLGIAGYIEDGSVILIDEPEISLHPEWQEDFMDLLKASFRRYKRCQFIIATHSPQIISRMKGRNSFIYSLGKGCLYRADQFSSRSADYQLAELFDSPGLMNEYISRLSFNLVAEMRSRKVIDAEISEKLKKLSAIAVNVDEKDPTSKLIESVFLLADKYA